MVGFVDCNFDALVVFAMSGRRVFISSRQEEETHLTFCLQCAMCNMQCAMQPYRYKKMVADGWDDK